MSDVIHVQALSVPGEWEEVFTGAARAALEARLPAYVAGRRWFRDKSRAIASVKIAHAVPLPRSEARVVWTILRIDYEDGGEGDEYTLPLTFMTGHDAAELRAHRHHLAVAALRAGDIEGWLCDALGSARAVAGMLNLIERGAEASCEGAALRFRAIGEPAPDGQDLSPRLVDAEQTNTSVILGDAYILKLIRKVDEGTSPDLEMGEFLTAAGYRNAPPVAGAIELLRNGEPATLGIMHRFAANQGDAWSFMLGAIGHFLEGMAQRVVPIGAMTPEDAEAALGDAGPLLRLLGTRVAEMHVALASRPELSAFAPEPLERAERAILGDAVRASLARAFEKLRARQASLPPEIGARVESLMARETDLDKRLQSFVELEAGVVKMRVHGDLHLGQVLFTGNDFLIIDFEGEPARPLPLRKAKRSPLADVAGMLRSLHYASVAAARDADSPVGLGAAREAWAASWHRYARAAFLLSYFAAARGPFLGRDPRAFATILDFYLLEKCVYEINYEIDNRPHWVAIPVAGLVDLLEGDDAKAR